MRKFLLPFVLFLLFATDNYGQNNTGTPYSIYGFGLIPENTGPYSAMGGVGAAMRDYSNINTLNPASYTALDSNRFYFQVGMTGEYVNISTHKENLSYRVAQNAALNIALRLYKNLYGSLGFTERSDVGYDLMYSDFIPGTENTFFNQHIQGEGGLNDFYLGVAWRYKNLSVGLNTALVFGKIEKRQILITPLSNSYFISSSDNTRVSDVLFDFGLQYQFMLSGKSSLTLGSAFNLGTKLYAERQYIAVKSNSQTPISNDPAKKGSISYPFRITTGINYNTKDRWDFAGDYTFQNMSAYEVFGENQGFNDYHKGSAGISYLPERYGRYWWQRNRYMMGAYFVRSHIELKNTKINTFGFTLGSQMPFTTRNGELLLGVALDLGIRGNERNGLIQEKYAKLRVSIAFKEGWFIKRKIN